MAKQIIVQVTADTSQAIGSIKELDDAIKQLEAELSSAPLGSKEFNRLSTEVKKAKAEMDKLSTTTEEFSNKAVAVGDSVEKIGTGIAGAFAVATGVVGAFGDSLGYSAEEIQAAQEKAQSYVAILTGLKPVIEGAKAAQALFNTVAAANPIGLIVVGIALLIAAFIAFKEPIIEFISDWENLKLILLAMLGPIGWIIIAYQKLFSEEAKLEDQRQSDRQKQLEREKARADALQDELKGIDARKNATIKAADDTIEALELEIDTLDAQGKSSDAATLKILEAELAKVQAIQDANAEKIQSYISYYTDLAALRGQDIESFKESMRAQGIDLDNLQDRANDLLEKNQDNIQRAKNQINKFKREAAEQRASDAKEAQDEIDAINEAAYQAEHTRLLNLQQLRNEFLQELEDAQTEYYDSLLTDQQREEQAVGDKYFRLIEMAKQYGEDTTVLEEAQQAALDEIRQKYIDKKLADEKATADAEMETAKIVSDYKASLLNSDINNVSNAFNLLGKISQKSRALQAVAIVGENAAGIAKQVIATKIANAAATAKYSLIPGGIALAAAESARNNIALGIGIAASVAATAMALSALKAGGSASSGSSSAGSSSGTPSASLPTADAAPPSFNLFGGGNNANDVGAGSDNGNDFNRNYTIKAVVSETDLVNTQDRLAAIREGTEL